MLEKIKNLSLENLNIEFKRLYHGRGENSLKFVTIDSIDTILFVQFYEDSNLKTDILNILKEKIKNTRFKNIIVKERFNNNTYAVLGEIPKEAFATENNIKFKLNFNNLNIGYFGDMKEGRAYIKTISKDKNILNLFSYTCGFSLFARAGGAKSIVNVDMSKSALSIGMQNHALNNLSLKDISFWPINILKSFPKLLRKAPYDVIIIDPPTFQKNSFDATKDYIKIINFLSKISKKDTILLSCINSPFFTRDELINLVENNSSFKFHNQLANPKEYTNSSLKALLFKT